VSRTVHHTPRRHWNACAAENNPFGNDYTCRDAHVIYGLRYATPEAEPKAVRSAVRSYRWSWGHGGGPGLGDYANGLERSERAALRAYRRAIVQTHRGGGDLEDIPEPDTRTRHGAHWEYF
jgi:hypothetical protein